MVDYRVEVVSAAPSPCAVVRERTTWSAFDWKSMLDQVWAYLRSRPEISPGHNVMIYHLLPESDEDDVEVEVGVEIAAGVEVPAAVEPEGRLVGSELPAGRAATVLHLGGPASLDDAYQALTQWCTEHGEIRSDTHWEVYGDPDAAGNYPIRLCWLLR
ncbi:GyrI-like domain-containing protein [Microlunatus elymi]|uniref:GyrI-like domain-containing protein n=1 Tax=Microlunatus elymi TaxID=2596828 RepID=A0A516Q170_9ACTN|nr:GyrI-like domain-containing protein [Microlunatus elymi]QDP97148.1 GyrI-like domain-containing protein [Microlunatus elymi]